MTVGFSTDLRNARLQAIIDKLDAGSGAGYLEFYSAVRPATGAAITDQTLLATCVLSDPCGTISDGVLTFDTIADDVAADADGDIAWARAFDSDANFVADFSCGTSGADINFNTVTAKVGGVVQILSGSMTEGNA